MPKRLVVSSAIGITGVRQPSYPVQHTTAIKAGLATAHRQLHQVPVAHGVRQCPMPSVPGESPEIAAGEHLLAQRDVPASTAFDAAEASGVDPVPCAAGRWLSAMLAGDFEAAWHESDELRQSNTPDPHRVWLGEELRGARLIVRCLHGFGDAVQMLRYAPLLREQADSVVFEVPPRLLPLAPFFAGLDDVITWGEDAPAKLPTWDVQIEIMELSYIFRTQLRDLPIATNYLHLPRHVVDQAASKMPAKLGPRIGVAWSGGEWNPSRSLPFSLLKPLLSDPAWEFWNLQRGDAASEAAGFAMQDATLLCGDGLLPLAATIANLDLVLTIDTLAAHLSGALGKPTWLLLQHAADWRWMTARSDSPWYPTLRLFRQPSPGDWPGTIAAVRRALRGFTP